MSFYNYSCLCLAWKCTMCFHVATVCARVILSGSSISACGTFRSFPSKCNGRVSSKLKFKKILKKLPKHHQLQDQTQWSISPVHLSFCICYSIIICRFALHEASLHMCMHCKLRLKLNCVAKYVLKPTDNIHM